MGRKRDGFCKGVKKTTWRVLHQEGLFIRMKGQVAPFTILGWSVVSWAITALLQLLDQPPALVDYSLEANSIFSQ